MDNDFVKVVIPLEKLHLLFGLAESVNIVRDLNFHNEGKSDEVIFCRCGFGTIRIKCDRIQLFKKVFCRIMDRHKLRMFPAKSPLLFLAHFGQSAPLDAVIAALHIIKGHIDFTMYFYAANMKTGLAKLIPLYDLIRDKDGKTCETGRYLTSVSRFNRH